MGILKRSITKFSETKFKRWVTFVCNKCKAGFQVENINTLGITLSLIKCPFCQNMEIERQKFEKWGSGKIRVHEIRKQ